MRLQLQLINLFRRLLGKKKRFRVLKFLKLKKIKYFDAFRFCVDDFEAIFAKHILLLTKMNVAPHVFDATYGMRKVFYMEREKKKEYLKDYFLKW